MIIWTRSLVHETVNVIFNNDNLETIGDKIMSGDFIRYINQRFSRLTPSITSNFHDSYMSEDYQKYWAIDLHLFKRSIHSEHLKQTNKTITDTIESFFGAMTEVFLNIEEGMNLIITFKIMTLICNSIPFSKDKKFKNPMSKVNSINSSHNLVSTMDDKLMTMKSINMPSKYKRKPDQVKIYIHISPRLEEWYNQIDREHFGGNMLSVIGLSYVYDIDSSSINEESFNMWNRISDIYDQNGISIGRRKHSFSSFIDYLKTNAGILYSNLIIKLKNDFGEDNIETTIESLDFKDKKTFGYIILFRNIIDNSGTQQIIHKDDGFQTEDRMDEDYQSPFESIIQTKNLAVVPFVQKHNVITIPKRLTNKLNSLLVDDVLKSSKLAAVAKYLGEDFNE